MTPREQIISKAFEQFAKIRREAMDAIVSAWIDQALRHAGEPGLTEPERRLVSACCSCGWAVPYNEPEPSGDPGFDSLPTIGPGRVQGRPDRGQKRLFF